MSARKPKKEPKRMPDLQTTPKVKKATKKGLKKDILVIRNLIMLYVKAKFLHGLRNYFVDWEAIIVRKVRTSMPY